jgi:acid phosphatase (class A)
MTHLFRFALLAFLLAPAAGFSPLHAKDADDRKLHWLTPDQEQAIIAALPPSPTAGSPEDQADLAGVLQAQATRTPAQIAHAKTEQNFSPELFQASVGPAFSPDREPKIYELIKRACRDGGTSDLDAKAKWARPRPFVSHPEVHPIFGAGGFSYPSGHATAAYVCGVLLGEIFPDKKAVLLQQSAQIAGDRVIAGVHYPSDIVAGEQLGRAVAQALLANPEFQQKLAAAKAELMAPAGK